MPETVAVDLTPAGFTGENAQENIKRANKAVADLDKANADYANQMEEILSMIGREQFIDLLRSLLGREDAKNYVDEIDAINSRRAAAREEMLRSMANRSPA